MVFTFCVFCKNNGEDKSFYNSHTLKDDDGNEIAQFYAFKVRNSKLIYKKPRALSDLNCGLKRLIPLKTMIIKAHFTAIFTTELSSMFEVRPLNA